MDNNLEELLEIRNEFLSKIQKIRLDRDKAIRKARDEYESEIIRNS